MSQGFESYNAATAVKFDIFRSKDLWKSMEKLDNIRQEVLSVWQQKGIDVIIAPGFVFPALPAVKYPDQLGTAASYTAVYNLLNFPAGSVPVTRVIPEDEVDTEGQEKKFCCSVYHCAGSNS